MPDILREPLTEALSKQDDHGFKQDDHGSEWAEGLLLSDTG
jgi:hypothetical protein